MVDATDPSAAAARRSKNEPDPLLGRVINDRFRILAPIARGGMGRVYRAEQLPLGRPVALKILHPNYTGENDPDFHKRFFLEASICSKLTHPNTVTIFDYGRTDDEVYYIAMELLEGKTLHKTLRENGALPIERAVPIARQVCKSLREAHGVGVIHRDLKPANILLVQHGDEQDFVKVLDFGLVKEVADNSEELTQTGLFMGSPKYMAPEQIRGEGVDTRCDIYSLGVILYEMLTGKVPFDRPNSMNILVAHVNEPPPPMKESNPDVEVPAELESIVMRAIAKRPSERFGSMEEMLGALSKFLGMGPGGDRATSLPAKPTPELAASAVNAPTHSLTPTPSQGVAVGVSGSVSQPFRNVVPVHKRPAVLGTITVLSLALAGALFFSRAATKESRVTEAVVATEKVRPIAAPAEEKPPREPVASVIVELRSEPPGAMVAVGNRRYGPTPADIEWTGEEATPGREISFRFQRRGFRDLTVTRTILGPRLEVSADLQKGEGGTLLDPPRRSRRSGE